MDRYRTSDGQWTVELVTLTATPDNRDGERLRVRHLGYFVADLRDITEIGRYFPLTELQPDGGLPLARRSEPHGRRPAAR